MAGRLRIVGVFNLPHLRGRLGPPEVNHWGWGGMGPPAPSVGARGWHLEPDLRRPLCRQPGPEPLCPPPLLAPARTPPQPSPLYCRPLPDFLVLPSLLFRRSLRADSVSGVPVAGGGHVAYKPASLSGHSSACLCGLEKVASCF